MEQRGRRAMGEQEAMEEQGVLVLLELLEMPHIVIILIL
jgi:hypothetical protein